MLIGLIDVDGHHFPNLALMRISAWHKAQGDKVEWYQGPMFGRWYDIVYMSKVFSNDYTPDVLDPINATEIRKGGTGYCIYKGEDGKEHFDQSKNNSLPPEVEQMFPDYSLYPEIPFAVSMTSRSCPRGCGFCHVAAKEGRRAAVKVADVKDFWTPELGKNEIKVMDSNIVSCWNKRDLMGQYRETGVWIDYMSGIDIRLCNEEDVDDLNHTKIKMIHTAWDNPEDDLRDKLAWFTDRLRIKDYRRKTVYVLTNYQQCSVEEHVERALTRIRTSWELGYTPYVMLYDKPNAAQKLRDLQRWCNNVRIFKSCPNFEDYKRRQA